MEIDAFFENMMKKLKKLVEEGSDFEPVSFDRSLACQIAPALRMLYAGDGMAVAVFCTNKQVQKCVANAEEFDKNVKPFLLDDLVYYNDEPLFIESDCDIADAFTAFEARKGHKPKIVAVQGLGFFALGKNKKETELARLLFLYVLKTAVYTKSFDGVLPMSDDIKVFIEKWETESYRSRDATASLAGGRLAGRIALVTGGAQGFGKGISEHMAAEGAYIVIADLNRNGAMSFASELNTRYGSYKAIAVGADVTDAGSVEMMVEEAVLAFGGLDILLSNAGVLVAGSLSDMTEENFDFVTNVNYKGYFLCAKYASKPMMVQHKFSPGYLMDIIEINSKSGIEGSNRNSAYSGSKFGGIGLTQSFALELIDHGIKVNAICPGNYFDGPLWSDPEKGLLRQYLDSGKIPGAKTLQDAIRFYEEKVPMRRGCAIEDVACAVLYVVEQKYETGQAIPVTGGQVMLK